MGCNSSTAAVAPVAAEDADGDKAKSGAGSASSRTSRTCDRCGAKEGVPVDENGKDLPPVKKPREVREVPDGEDEEAEELHKKLQQEVENFQALQKQYQKTLSVRQQLGGQLFENETVKTELDLVKKDQEVYKLIGPVLIKQDIEEALQNVNKRMDYIKGELKRVDDTITDMEKKQDNQRDVLNKLQQQYQKAQLVAATK